MNILLVNDDGYKCEGINILFNKLQKYGNVIMVAPKEFMSAKSCSLTLKSSLEFKEFDKNKYYLSGFPADCVSFAFWYFKDFKFDLVVSGCNDGPNISYDTLYSGTIGACLQASKQGYKAIAFSCPHNFEILENNFDKVMQYILDKNLLSAEYFLNVNFPHGQTIDDIKMATLYYRNDYNYFDIDEEGRYIAKRYEEKDITDEESDCYLIDHHIVSIQPLSNSYFNQEVYNKLK